MTICRIFQVFVVVQSEKYFGWPAKKKKKRQSGQQKSKKLISIGGWKLFSSQRSWDSDFIYFYRFALIISNRRECI